MKTKRFFQTTREQREEIPYHIGRLRPYGYRKDFLEAVAALAEEDQGVFELLSLLEEASGGERDAIIEELEDATGTFAS